MSSVVARDVVPRFELVDLSRVRAAELEVFWREEIQQWSERLHWNVSGAISVLRRTSERGGLRGKALREGGRTVGYAYYVIEGSRGVLSGLALAPRGDRAELATALLRAVTQDMRVSGVTRVETQFVSFETPGLARCFEQEGFECYWRDFLRRELHPKWMKIVRSRWVTISPFGSADVSPAATIMVKAHRGQVDSRMNELYRDASGCHVLLENILRQRGCGVPISEASSTARERATDRPVGFAVATEIAPRHAHLAQIAVVPEVQGQGIGQALLSRVMAGLAELGYQTLSLMVSRGNERARHLYLQSEFRPVVSFPVFSWTA